MRGSPPRRSCRSLSRRRVFSDTIDAPRQPCQIECSSGARDRCAIARARHSPREISNGKRRSRQPLAGCVILLLYLAAIIGCSVCCRSNMRPCVSGRPHIPAIYRSVIFAVGEWGLIQCWLMSSTGGSGGGGKGGAVVWLSGLR